MVVANAWAAMGHAAGAASTVVIAQKSHFTSTHFHHYHSSSAAASFAPEYSGFTTNKSAINLPKRLLIPLRNSRISELSCRCTNDSAANSSNSSSCSSSSSSASDWDWNRWTRHFSEIEQAESYASVLKFQLEEAIENQDFEEAAKLKAAIAEATSMDSVADIMSQLKNAIDEECYHDASHLCKSTGSGLVGWWVGYGKDSDDPFGKLIHITPGVGRFVGKSYSPRQLVNASPGTPLFEIFVVKDGDEKYIMQVVFLRHSRGTRTNSVGQSNSKPVKGSSAEIDNASVIDVKMNEEKAEKIDEKSMNFEVATEEGIKSVINFLKDKMPELKVKVVKVKVTEEDINDSDAVNKLMGDEDEDTNLSDNSEDDATNLDDIPPDRVSLGGGTDEMEDGKNLDTRLFIGEVFHNKEDNFYKDEYVRVPAGVKDVKRDSFVLHIPMREQEHDVEETTVPRFKVAALVAQSVSELMPPEVAKAFCSSDKVAAKVSRDAREIVKLAVSLAQKCGRLSECTNFSRIVTTQSDLDPFDGLYVGAFGPYGTEVVQLRRKYGNWNLLDDSDKSSDVEFFEYVEAVKLTGDLNVPGGEVTFRAKIGKGNRLSNRGLYPDELGVVASFKGQGRIAEFGFKNPRWVEGELLQLNGKGMGPYVRGADLGFLYVVPEQSFLVLFNRLKLPE